MSAAATAVLVLLSTMLRASSADQCAPVPDSQASPLPSFDVDEFTVDVEISSKERSRVIQSTLYYSKPKNMMRLSMLDQSQKTDLYFYFMDDEVMAFQYSSGRGSCQVQNISTSAEAYVVGGVKADGKIPEALGVLRMTGASGFPSNAQIKVQKGPQTTLRAMTVDQYTSCQLWRYKQQDQTMTVTHYWSVPSQWQFPDGRLVPVAIKVDGSGRLKNQTQSITHVYSFFNFKFSVDDGALETPAGIYCDRRAVYPFPPSPSYIRFSGESINNQIGYTQYFTETFDFDDKFAIMTMQDQSSTSSTKGMDRRTYFRDYNTGLSFDIDNQLQSCSVRNISDPAELKLPFDMINANGKVNELSADAFFYKANTSYEYLGQRTVRSIPCDVFIAKTKLLTVPGNNLATIEWYFAKQGTRSWNDATQFYVNNKFRLPVKFRVWQDDFTKSSTDINMYHVDYAKLRYGTMNIRPCFPNYASNYMQLVLPNAKKNVVGANIDTFKWDSTFKLAETGGVIWWRVADLQVYFEVNDVILEFELLDAPPYSGDSPFPYTHLALSEATANIQAAVSRGFSLNVYNPTGNTFNKTVTVSSTKIAANKALTGSTGGGYGAGSLAGLGIGMVVIGGVTGGLGAHFFNKR